MSTLQQTLMEWSAEDENRLDLYWRAIEAKAARVNHTDRGARSYVPRSGPIPVYHFAYDNSPDDDAGPVEDYTGFDDEGRLCVYTSSGFSDAFRARYCAPVRCVTTFMDLRDIIEYHTGAPAPWRNEDGTLDPEVYNPLTDDAMLEPSALEFIAEAPDPAVRRERYMNAMLVAAYSRGLIDDLSWQANTKSARLYDFLRMVLAGWTPPSRVVGMVLIESDMTPARQ